MRAARPSMRASGSSANPAHVLRASMNASTSLSKITHRGRFFVPTFTAASTPSAISRRTCAGVTRSTSAASAGVTSFG